MKNIIIYLFSLLVFTSCESYFGDVNVDPNKPSTAPASSLLPTIQTSIAYTYWGDVSRYTSIYSQHLKGNNRQFEAFDDYIFKNGDFDTVWGNIYADILKDLNTLRVNSDSEGDDNYAGIARVLEAHQLLIATLIWGDIPYSEAFMGADNQKPKYDTQEEIFATVLRLLDEGLAKISAGKGAIVGNDDIIYGGDLAKWTKFAEGIRARTYLQLGQKDAANYEKALSAAKKSFESSAEEATFAFLTATPSNAPWYQYITQRGDVEPNPTVLGLLKEGDPRKELYAEKLLDNTEHPIFTKDQAVQLLSYTEVQFIIAETSKRTGKDSDAKMALVNSINAACALYGLEATKDLLSIEATLENILTQKYVSEFMNPQAFFDYRRTNVPKLVPNAGSKIPTRLLYPLTEVNFNTNETNRNDSIYSTMWINE